MTDGTGRRRGAGVERRMLAMVSSLVVGNAGGTAAGLVFWLLAARALAVDDVGRLHAACSAAGLLAVLASAGLGPLLVGELPRLAPERRWELFCAGVSTPVVLGAVVGAGFAVAAWATTTLWRPFAPGGADFWWFLIMVAGTSLALVLDHVMLTVGNPMAQAWRSLAAGLWKVLVLAVAMLLARATTSVGLAAWGSGLLLAGAGAVWAAARELPERARMGPGTIPGLLRRHARSAAGHLGVNALLTGSAFLVPLIVAFTVPPRLNGIFAPVWLAVSVALFLPYAIAFALFAATGGAAEDRSRSRRSALASWGVATVVAMALTAVAPWALLPFGPGYADGATTLQIMAWAVPLSVAKDQHVAGLRIRRSVAAGLPGVAALVLLELVGVLVGALHGALEGAALGWVLALLLQTVVLAPRLAASGGATGGRTVEECR